MTPRRSPSLVGYPRSADEIAAVLARLLGQAGFAEPGFAEPGFAEPGGDPLADALVRITARYGEVVTRCLNAAPELHLAAFAELLGRQPRPAAAARVHVSFRPAAGDAGRPVAVPMATRLAIQGAGGAAPALFETLAALDLVRAEAVRAVLVDAGHRRAAAVDGIVLPAVDGIVLRARVDGARVDGARVDGVGLDGDARALLAPLPYALHIGQPQTFGLPGLQRLLVRLDVQDAGSGEPSSSLDWLVPTPAGELPLVVEQDGTDGLTRSGDVVLVPPASWPATAVAAIPSLWLTLRLRRAPPATQAGPHWRPPRLAAVAIRAVAATGPQAPAAACHDGAPLDLSKDFFPFGERPRFGTVFQLLCPAFAEPGAAIEMAVRLTNPLGATAAPIPPVSRGGSPGVVWEIATSRGFQALAVADGTHSFTQDGTLAFTVPDDVAVMAIAGTSGAWVRARLASGHYGTATVSDPIARTAMCAPAIRSLTVRARLERGPLPPEHLVSQGALASRRLDPRLPAPVDAFLPPDVDGPALYIGLDGLAPGSPTPGPLVTGRVLSWHVRPAPPAPPVVLGPSTANAAAPRWQVHAAGGWRDAAVDDGSAGLTRSGIVTLTLPDAPAPDTSAPDTSAPWPDSVLDPGGRAWAVLRIVWPPAPTLPPLPVRLTLNSVAARHSQRLSNEILGSGTGRAEQVCKALRTPVIGAVLLQIRETDDDWIAWQEVASLAGSDASSRHFTLDRSTGELRFGDGRHGRIPPPGANNIRLRHYTTGGGRLGNQPEDASVQLQSAVPAVDSVRVLEPASGGLDAEDPARVRAHASAWLRHRDRAICADDFAELAVNASPEVARAFCIASTEMAGTEMAGPEMAGPAVQHGVVAIPGVFSVIIMPRGSAPRPQPSLDLLATVKAYLDARRSPAGCLVVAGPGYAAVAVRLQVALAHGWPPGPVQLACRQRIAAFLHPLTGNATGRGWAPGQRPHKSDLYGLLDGLDGVDFIRALSLSIASPAGLPVIVAAGAVDVECGDVEWGP